MTYNLYSIGHGNSEIDSFISNLKKYELQLIVDLRSVPFSKIVPEFNQKDLVEKLKENNIDYLFFGDKLGGRPQNGFSNFVESPEFKKNIGKLLFLVKNKNTALMCSEFNHMNCHRKFITDLLRKNGVEVKNIDRNGGMVKEEQFSIKQYQR
jgi:uncharacterized protein (DUF488 family)